MINEFYDQWNERKFPCNNCICLPACISKLNLNKIPCENHDYINEDCIDCINKCIELLLDTKRPMGCTNLRQYVILDIAFNTNTNIERLFEFINFFKQKGFLKC